jgi:T5SS/PEP-CTERM-associated repeat protein
VIATGDVVPSGATDPWEIDGELKVGNTGEGTLNIEAGGVVSVVSSRWVASIIGYESGSVGTATVTGDGSEWNNSSSLYVGRSGEGTLNIESGGVVTNTYGYIGYYADSVGTVTVTGEGSEWNNSRSLGVGLYGDEGTLNIMDGGTVNVDGTTWVAKEAGISEILYSSGVINFDNGVLNTGNLFSSSDNLQGTGTINTHGLVSDVNLIFDRPSSLSQSFTLDDPGKNITLNLEVDGTGSIGVGYEGTALLHISGGVKVESAYGYLGYKAGSSGTAFVVGEGSEWNNSGDLRVGLYGEGTLNISDGGVVTNMAGYLGYYSDSVGTATVTGEGSEWNNSYSLYVGSYGGEGTLNIESGGVVSSRLHSHIGYDSDSVGTVTVTGEGSEWNNSETLYVGNEGEGTLNIESGGVVSNTSGYVGYLSDSVGTVTVTGEGSEWNNSEFLVVGQRGNGTLNITDGGVANAVGTTVLWSNSTLHIELSNPTSGPSLFTDVLYLGGILEISLADGFLPELGNSFGILDFNTVSGSFAEMNLPVLVGGLEWDTSQLLVDGTLYAGAIPLAGDFNYDGTVDAADYTVWQDNGGDQADYLLWKTNFEALASGSSESVPEPTTAILVLMMCVGYCRSRL